jgi:hypothetical protein
VRVLTVFALVLGAAATLAACKFPELPPLDDIDAPPGDGDGGNIDADNTDARPTTVQAIAVATDYGSPGRLGLFDIATHALVSNNVTTAALANDPSARFIGDEVYIVNRYMGGTVVVLDPDDWSMVFSGTIGPSSNPQDVAVVGTKLFVPALATNGLRILDRSNPGTIRSVDLSSLDSADGLPDCTSAYAVGNTVVVVCGILDASFAPRGPGQVVYIDATTETVITTRAMPVTNPLGLLQATPPAGPLAGDLLMPSADFSPPNDGCLMRIPTTPGNPTCLVTNATIGSNVDAMAPSVNGAVVYMVAAGQVRAYDVLGSSLGTGGVAGTNYTALGVCPDDTIIVGASMGSPQGIRMFRNSIELTTAAIDLGKPPAFGNSINCYRR